MDMELVFWRPEGADHEGNVFGFGSILDIMNSKLWSGVGGVNSEVILSLGICA